MQFVGSMRALRLTPTLVALGTVLTISLFSGYRSPGSNLAASWPFSPLGLLTEFRPEHLELHSRASFEGRYSGSLDYFRVYLLTCALEAPFFAFLFRRKERLLTASGAFALFQANALTHPIVFFIFPLLFSRYLDSLLLSELFAPVLETIWAVGVARARSPFLCAAVLVLANLFSWQAGVLI